MAFIDEAKIRVIAGKGGNGCISFRREAHIPKGGPDGGDGGRGGSVIFEGSHDVQTLLDFRYLREYRAKNGEPGRGAQCYGRAAESIVLKVPLGTIIHSEDGEIEMDITQHGQRIVVAEGGKGGLGNMHFKSSTRQAPRIATPGAEGQVRELHLELKLLSQVGLVGFPNAGKSSLLRGISLAQPKVGDYPFTTLEPHLGVIPGDPPLTVADIPGIIEGAHRGLGLGLQFLRHISRASYLLFLISFDHERTLDRTYRILLDELRDYDPSLLRRPRLVCVNKADLLEPGVEAENISQDVSLWREDWKAFSKNVPGSLLISVKTKYGLNELTERLRTELLKPSLAMVS